jgi:hypothetical protein
VIFGNSVASPATAAAADWVAGACRGVWGTVGALVPNQYPLILHAHAPEPDIVDWWSQYSELFRTIATIGEQHTSDPERAWFAVWEGHGFDTTTSHYSWQGPVDDATRQALEQKRSRLRIENERRNAATRAALHTVPRFDLPHRSYYLLAGPVTAATQVREPGSPGRWQRPDLFWPDDRRWFVATDVDFWSLYIGGDHDFISELARSAPTPSETVTLDHQLEPED